MKRSNLSKVVGAGVVALSLAILPSSLPTLAQDNTAPGTTTDGLPSTGVADEVNEDNDFDLGWLGLIGLAGLAGLAGRKRSETVAYREPTSR